MKVKSFFFFKNAEINGASPIQKLCCFVQYMNKTTGGCDNICSCGFYMFPNSGTDTSATVSVTTQQHVGYTVQVKSGSWDFTFLTRLIILADSF